MEKEKSLTALQDIVENSAAKICFVCSFFALRGPDEEPEISDKDASGLFNILQEIENDLEFVVDKLSEKKQKGLIIEKEID
jgi:hypothetical protein